MSLAKTARDLTKFAFKYLADEGLTVSATYRAIKGAPDTGDRITLNPQPTLYPVNLVDNAPAHSTERTTQGDMRNTEERPEKQFLLDWFQVENQGFLPAENDELDVAEKAGTVRYRIDQVSSDPIKAHYVLESRRSGGSG